MFAAKIISPHSSAPETIMGRVRHDVISRSRQEWNQPQTFRSTSRTLDCERSASSVTSAARWSGPSLDWSGSCRHFGLRVNAAIRQSAPSSIGQVASTDESYIQLYRVFLVGLDLR